MSEKLNALLPKISPLLRMLGSGADGEIVNAVRALLRMLASAGLDIHVLVERLETPPLSHDEMQKIFDAGYAKRCADEAEQRRRSAVAVTSFATGDVGDGVNGYSWKEVIGHCLVNKQRIRNAWEANFVESVAEQLASSHYSKPTEKQAPILRRIFQSWFDGKI